MTSSFRLLTFSGLAFGSMLWLSGCTPAAKDAPKTATEAQGDHDHADADHHHDTDKHADHEDQPLTEKDVQLPDNFKSGVSRLEELHHKIEHLIEHNELNDVHRTAEEMAIVARKMKELAGKDLTPDQQTEAGRLCNDIAGYYKPIDAAADAGKKDETTSISQQMGKTLEKLKAFAG